MFGTMLKLSANTIGENINLNASEPETKCIHLQNFVDKLKKHTIEYRKYCDDVRSKYVELKGKMESYKADLIKFASLRTIRSRILYMERILGKNWSGFEEQKPINNTMEEELRYHHGLWSWIVGVSTDSRAVKIRGYIEQEGLKGVDFCLSMVNVLISTSCLRDLTVTRLDTGVRRNATDVLKSLPLDDVTFKSVHIIMQNDLISA